MKKTPTDLRQCFSNFNMHQNHLGTLVDMKILTQQVWDGPGILLDYALGQNL